MTKRGRLSRSLLVLLAASLATACGAVTLARGTKGADVSGVQPGVARPEAETALGKPQKDWVSPAGVHYYLYEYDTGRPPNAADAAGFVFMDIVTLGMWEMIDAMHDHRALNQSLPPPTSARVVLSYDDKDLVMGIFGEFDALPADGRSGPRAWSPSDPR